MNAFGFAERNKEGRGWAPITLNNEEGGSETRGQYPRYRVVARGMGERGGRATVVREFGAP